MISVLAIIGAAWCFCSLARILQWLRRRIDRRMGGRPVWSPNDAPPLCHECGLSVDPLGPRYLVSQRRDWGWGSVVTTYHRNCLQIGCPNG